METFHPLFAPGLVTPGHDSRVAGLRYQPFELVQPGMDKLAQNMQARFMQCGAGAQLYIASGHLLTVISPHKCNGQCRDHCNVQMRSDVQLSSRIESLVVSDCGLCCLVGCGHWTYLYALLNGKLICVFKGEAKIRYQLDPWVGLETILKNGRELTHHAALVASNYKVYRVRWTSYRFRTQHRLSALDIDYCEIPGVEWHIGEALDQYEPAFILPGVLSFGDRRIRVVQQVSNSVETLKLQVEPASKPFILCASKITGHWRNFVLTNRGFCHGGVEYLVDFSPAKIITQRVAEDQKVAYKFYKDGVLENTRVVPSFDTIRRIWLLSRDEDLYHMVVDLGTGLVLQLPRIVAGKTADIFLYRGAVVALQLGGLRLPAEYHAEIGEKLQKYLSLQAETVLEMPFLDLPELPVPRQEGFQESFVLDTHFRVQEASAEDRLRNLGLFITSQPQ